MASFGSSEGNVLYLISCAAPPAQQLTSLVEKLQQAGWNTCVILTPAASRWVDAGVLTKLTGNLVRINFRGPCDPEFAPRGDAVLVAPATFNTINKCAAGASDNLALGLMNEAIGRHIRMAIVPWVNDALAAHPAYEHSLTRLASAGVRIAPPQPGRGIDSVALGAVGLPPP